MNEVLTLQNNPKKKTPDQPLPKLEFSDAENENRERQERLESMKEWTRQYLENHFPEYEINTEWDFINYCAERGFATILNRKERATLSDEQSAKIAEQLQHTPRSINYLQHLRDKQMVRLFGYPDDFEQESLDEQTLRLPYDVELTPEEQRQWVEADMRREKERKRQSKLGRYEDEDIRMDSDVAEAFLHETINFMLRKQREDPKGFDRFCEGMWADSKLDGWAVQKLAPAALVSVYMHHERFAGLENANTPFNIIRTYTASMLANRSADEVRRLASELADRSPGERMDVIQFLPTPIFIDEDLRSTEAAKQESREKYRLILETLAETDIAAIRFSAQNRLTEQENAWRQIDEADRETSLPDKEIEASFYDREELLTAKRLKSTIIPRKGVYYDYSVSRIGADAVAFLDGSGFPQHIVRLAPETLDHLASQESEVDLLEATLLKRSTERRRAFTRTIARKTIRMIVELLAEEKERTDTEYLANILFDVSPVLTREEWKTFFNEEERLAEIRDEFIAYDDEEFEALETERQKLHREIVEIAKRLEGNDTEKHEPREFLEAEKERLLQEDKQIVEAGLHGHFELASQKQDKETAVREKVDALLDTLLTHPGTFKENVITYLDNILEQARTDGKLVEVSPMTYDEFVHDSSLNPFGNIDPEAIKIIQNLHSPEAKDFLGMDFSRLPLRAQIQFLLFRGKEKTSDAERFRLALGKHREITDDLAYSFLATAESPEYGETILILAERFDTDTLGPILRRYAELTQDTDAVTEYVRESFPNIEPAEVEREAIEISKKLLRRGRDLLVEFSQSPDADPKALLLQLDEARTDVILYKTAFRTLHESGSKEDLAEMMKSEIISLQGTELNEEEQEALLSIYDRNYPESDQYPAKFREKIFDGLRSAFDPSSSPDSRLYLLRRDGEIIGFRRFDAREETEDGRPRKYAGSFNIDPAYRDAKIGNVFYQVTLEREGTDSVIEALVDPETPVSSFYLERYGYVVDGVTDIEGKPFLTMRRDLEANGSFVTRDAAFDESISDIAEHVSEINERLSSVSAFAVDRTELFDLVRTKTEEGWILTRLPYGEGGRDGGKVIAVFENPSLRKRTAGTPAKESALEAA